MPDWKAGEGRLLDGKYPLERLIDGSNHSALFVTRSGAGVVRIRVVDRSAQAAALIGRWSHAERFPHANLIRIHAAGVGAMLGVSVAYLVMEYAEENLADVLRSRPLTPDEARTMLLPVATALDYLHRRGMTHGGVKPSHIFAIGEAVKISSESIAEGDPSADMLSLGSTINAVFAGAVPPPFNRIARGCLDPDPSRRWTAEQVIAGLTAAPALPVPPEPRPALRRFAAPAVLAAVTAGIVLGVMFRKTGAPPPAEPQSAPAAAAHQPTPPAPEPSPKTAAPAQSNDRSQSRDRLIMEDAVARRVLPKVPDQARSTITGKPAVIVRVTVDAAGNVIDAGLERTFSPYFGKLALEAVRKWKFVPAEEGARPRQWSLRFEFTSENTNVFVIGLSRTR